MQHNVDLDPAWNLQQAAEIKPLFIDPVLENAEFNIPPLYAAQTNFVHVRAYLCVYVRACVRACVRVFRCASSYARTWVSCDFL